MWVHYIKNAFCLFLTAHHTLDLRPITKHQKGMHFSLTNFTFYKILNTTEISACLSAAQLQVTHCLSGSNETVINIMHFFDNWGRKMSHWQNQHNRLHIKHTELSCTLLGPIGYQLLFSTQSIYSATWLQDKWNYMNFSVWHHLEVKLNSN